MSTGARRVALFDADAFNCLRSLGLLALLRDRTGFRIEFTGIVARHELNSLQTDVDNLVKAQRAKIHDLPAKDANRKRLVRQGADRGEAEAIAWALTQSNGARPVFVSNDALARRRAKKERVGTADLLDFVVEMVHRGLLNDSEAASRLATWDDRKQQQCRPKDWSRYASTAAARRSNPPDWTIP